MTTGASSRRAWCRATASWIGLLLAGCGPEVLPPRVVESAPPKPLDLDPLHDLLVGAGLGWLVICQAQALLRHPALSRGLERFAPQIRRRMFEKVTALDLDEVQELIVASYEDSTLLVFRGVGDPMEAEARFRDRLMNDTVRKSYQPGAVWSHGRTASGRERAMAALVPGVVALEDGGSLRSKVALLCALGRLRKSPRALDLPDMQQLLGDMTGAPLRFLAPGPFEGLWDDALHGVLAVCTAIGAWAHVGAEGQLDLHARFSGAWGEDASRASELLLASWRDIARSSLGRLLHLDEPIDGPEAESQPESVGLGVRLDGVKLLEGLYDVVAADVQEMMDTAGAGPE